MSGTAEFSRQIIADASLSLQDVTTLLAVRRAQASSLSDLAVTWKTWGLYHSEGRFLLALRPSPW